MKNIARAPRTPRRARKWTVPLRSQHAITPTSISNEFFRSLFGVASWFVAFSCSELRPARGEDGCRLAIRRGHMAGPTPNPASIGESCKPACSSKKRLKNFIGDAKWGNCMLQTQWYCLFACATWRSWRARYVFHFGVAARVVEAILG